MGVISDKKHNLINEMYYKKQMPIRAIAEILGVSIDAVTYFMRKHDMKRRTRTLSRNLIFQNKKLSFKEKPKLSLKQEKLKLAGLILYWGEGYKTSKSKGIDFANSDTDMILVFVAFLREIYGIDEKRLRVLLYCYSDQNISELIEFWSKLTSIPKDQFSKPYVRQDFKKDGRKMKYGMVHIRYSDKKLFLAIMNEIDQLKINMRRW